MSARIVSDGVYNIVNRPKQWRVIRAGVTWSSQVSDYPRAIEFCDDGTFNVRRLAMDDAGKLLTGPSKRGGVWEYLDNDLRLGPAPWERLVLTDEAVAKREPPYARGRDDKTLGLMIETDFGWRGSVQLGDRNVGVSFPCGDEDKRFARAVRVIELLRGGAFDSAKLQVAKQVMPEYRDWNRGSDRARTPQELAASMRCDTVSIDERGIATLWFGDVLTDHSVLGILSEDCQQATLSHP